MRRLENNPQLRIGDVTTINLTKISGGVQSNVIPPKMMLCFDVRLDLNVDHKEFEAKVIIIFCYSIQKKQHMYNVVKRINFYSYINGARKLVGI